MNEKEIKNLIRKGESANVEFKVSLSDWKNIIRRKGIGPQTYYIPSDISIGQYRTISDNSSYDKEE